MQTEHAKSAYEGYVAPATKLGELYANLAKEAFKPYEALSRKGSLIAAPARNAFIDHTLRRQHGLEVRARTG